MVVSSGTGRSGEEGGRGYGCCMGTLLCSIPEVVEVLSDISYRLRILHLQNVHLRGRSKVSGGSQPLSLGPYLFATLRLHSESGHMTRSGRANVLTEV